VTGAAGNITYAWSTGATSEDLNNIPAGIYDITVLDENGCQASQSFEVTAITTVTADAGADTTVCKGTILTLDGKGGTDVTWHPAAGLSNPNLPNPVVTIDTAATYILTVSGLNNCYDIDSVTISVFPTAGLSAGNDTTMSGDQITLNADGGPFTSYLWSPSESLDDPTIASPVAMPLVTTTYIISAVTEYGCTETDTITVKKPETLIVYNAFSPNGDGVNDYWDIDNATDYPDLKRL
jgi:hypothetical protein